MGSRAGSWQGSEARNVVPEGTSARRRLDYRQPAHNRKQGVFERFRLHVLAPLGAATALAFGCPAKWQESAPDKPARVDTPPLPGERRRAGLGKHSNRGFHPKRWIDTPEFCHFRTPIGSQCCWRPASANSAQGNAAQVILEKRVASKSAAPAHDGALTGSAACRPRRRSDRRVDHEKTVPWTRLVP